MDQMEGQCDDPVNPGQTQSYHWARSTKEQRCEAWEKDKLEENARWDMILSTCFILQMNVLRVRIQLSLRQSSNGHLT